MSSTEKLLNSEAIKMWDYEGNGKGPEKYTYGSGRKVYWKCSKGHSFKRPISQVYRSPICPRCKELYGNSTRKTHEEFEEEMLEVMGEEYETVTKYKGSDKPITIRHICGKEVEYAQADTVSSNKAGRCTDCYPHRNHKTQEEFLQEFEEASKGEYELLSKYTKALEPITVKHLKCGTVYETRASSFTDGNGCSKCYWITNKGQEGFEKEVQDIVGDEYTVMGEYVTGSVPIKLRHNICGSVFYVIPDEFTKRRQGVPTGTRCTNCRTSKGEQAIIDWGRDRGVELLTEVSFEGLKTSKSLLMDFYLPEYDVCIEYDGEQHYKSIPFWGGDEGLKGRRQRDEIKDKYCEENGIELIRILWTEFYEIPEILDRYFGLE